MKGVRFAPSPTGKLHLGNLRTAWISWRWAKKLGAPWVVRFEDIDRARTVPGSQAQQLEDLKLLGCSPDEVHLQSARKEAHYRWFLQALKEGRVYPCFCSRKELLSQIASAPHPEASDLEAQLKDLPAPSVYSGRCRDPKNLPRLEDFNSPTIAWRFRGETDFLIARSRFNRMALDQGAPPSLDEFEPSYHWACALDDFEGNYQLLVRAWDLGPAASLQREIQRWAAQSSGQASFQVTPLFHTALVISAPTQRLEKRTQGVTLGELGVSGVSPHQLQAAFEKSTQAIHWKITSDFDGETQRTLLLEDLRRLFTTAASSSSL